jgi:hypothetical protein
LLGFIAFLLLLREDGWMELVALFSGLGHTTAMGPYLCQTVNVRWLGHLYLGAPFKQATLWLLHWMQKKRDMQKGREVVVLVLPLGPRHLSSVAGYGELRPRQWR